MTVYANQVIKIFSKKSIIIKAILSAVRRSKCTTTHGEFKGKLCSGEKRKYKGYLMECEKFKKLLKQLLSAECKFKEKDHFEGCHCDKV